jgi:GNAT superfamily N-acetyltransferase
MSAAGRKMICHLRKFPLSCAAVEVPDAVLLRPFEDPVDVAGWLQLREVVFEATSPGVGKWTEHDFVREMSGKAWWRPDHTWVAVEGKQPESMLGAVTSILRSRKGGLVADVHWLMVHPAWQRRGIGQCLLQQLEQVMWHKGATQLCVETHRGWESAVRLYERLGYRTRL